MARPQSMRHVIRAPWGVHPILAWGIPALDGVALHSLQSRPRRCREGPVRLFMLAHEHTNNHRTRPRFRMPSQHRIPTAALTSRLFDAEELLRDAVADGDGYRHDQAVTGKIRARKPVRLRQVQVCRDRVALAGDR